MRELKDIKTTEQMDAFELYASYGLNLDFELPDLTRVYFTIIKDPNVKVSSSKVLMYYKELQNLLRYFRKMEKERKIKLEQSRADVQDDIDFLKSVGVNMKSVSAEKIIPEIEEEIIPAKAVLDTEEAKFFEPIKRETVILEESIKDEQTVEKEEIKQVQIEEKNKTEDKTEKTIESEFDLTELSYVDSTLTDIEKFAASYFEKTIEEPRTVIFADESSSVKTNLQEFKNVEMPEEEQKTDAKVDMSGILDDSYQTKTENFNKRHEEVKVDFGDLGNVEEEKKKNQNTINDDVPVDDDDPFIFGFTSIKR